MPLNKVANLIITACYCLCIANLVTSSKLFAPDQQREQCRQDHELCGQKPQSADGLVLRAGGAEHRFHVGFDVGGDAGQAALGGVEHVVASGAGVGEGNLGEDGFEVFGIELVVELG